MILIWGYRRSVLVVAMLTLVCQNCHNPAAHALRHVVTRFTFFFIPLFRLGSGRYFTQCTFCGTSGQLTKPQAEQLVAQQQQFAAMQAGGPPQLAQQPYAQPALPAAAPQQQYQQQYQAPYQAQPGQPPYPAQPQQPPYQR